MKSLAEINQRNSSFYGDGASPGNIQPGQSNIPGTNSMLAPSKRAQENNYPSQSIMPSEMGTGQNPHSYLEPKENDSLFRPNMGLDSFTPDKSNAVSGYDKPSVKGTYSEPTSSLEEMNAKNAEYWKGVELPDGSQQSLPENYPKHGPQVEPDSYGKN